MADTFKNPIQSMVWITSTGKPGSQIYNNGYAAKSHNLGEYLQVHAAEAKQLCAGGHWKLSGPPPTGPEYSGIPRAH